MNTLCPKSSSRVNIYEYELLPVAVAPQGTIKDSRHSSSCRWTTWAMPSLCSSLRPSLTAAWPPSSACPSGSSCWGHFLRGTLPSKGNNLAQVVYRITIFCHPVPFYLPHRKWMQPFSILYLSNKARTALLTEPRVLFTTALVDWPREKYWREKFYCWKISKH